MLPSDLLAVWKRKGVIMPRYARPTEENVEIASSLIEAYKLHVGGKKRVLKEFVMELEDRGFGYRFVRGLSFLLDRRSVFKCRDKLNPVDLRKRVFKESTKLGLATNPEKRTMIVAAVASQLNVETKEVEDYLYADLETELILENFAPLSPTELLEEYNLALTQTLLFDCTEMKFSASGNWQSIFRAIKRLGLIYEASRNGTFWVKIDGPASLFKQTKRYGTSIAKLMPVIATNSQWTVDAKILWKYTNELCSFKIESLKHGSLLRKKHLPPVSYDSSAEEDFAVRFEALRTEWRLFREPEPVLAGKQVLIPDFSLEREGVKVYMEVVGFWTQDYLLRKIEKLKKVEVPILVAIDENLACEKVVHLEKHEYLSFIYYRDGIPLAPVLRYLDKVFDAVHSRQTDFVRDLSIVFTEPVVSFREFADRIGVSIEAVRTALNENPPRDYVMLSSCMVRKDKLEEIRAKIEAGEHQRERLPLSDAVKIVQAEGVPDATNLLEVIGYRVLWRGIDAEKAEVIRK